MLIEKAVFPNLSTSICMLINSEDKKISFQYEVSKGDRVPLQRKIKGCGRDIIKLPGFKSLKKKNYPLQCKFILPPCEECILMKGSKYRFSTAMPFYCSALIIDQDSFYKNDG